MSKLSPCCARTFDHSGEPQGKIVDNLYGLKTYEVGSKANAATKGAIVIAADIYGYSYINNKLVADAFAREGYYVVVPDLLNEDFTIPEKFGEIGYFNDWLSRHPITAVATMFDDFASKMKQETKPKFLGGIGYCFGAKFVILNLSKNGLLDSGAVAHASFISHDDVEAICKPVLFSCAETDSIFTPELRAATETILAKNKQRYQVDLFSGVSHGFAVRGDLNNPVVKYAAEKALKDQICWFEHTSK